MLAALAQCVELGLIVEAAPGEPMPLRVKNADPENGPHVLAVHWLFRHSEEVVELLELFSREARWRAGPITQAAGHGRRRLPPARAHLRLVRGRRDEPRGSGDGHCG